MKYLLLLLLFSSCAIHPPEYYYGKGRVASANTDYLVAIKNFTKAIDKKHNYIEAYYERANASLAIDSIDNVIKDYDTLLVFIKENQIKRGELLYMRGNAFYLISKDSLACASWRQSKDLNYYKAWDAIRKYCK